jgi:lysozyme
MAQISEDGLKLLVEFEGLKLDAYQCTAGVWTIGIGSTKYDNGNPVKKGDKITQEEAYKLFLDTSDTYAACIKRYVIRPLKQNEFDALFCLCYNIGCGAFAKSSLVKFINGGQTIEKIRIGFLMWIKAGGVVSKGLMRRRLREFNLYAKIK